MRLKLTSLLCLWFGIFCSCSNKIYTLSELPETQLIFGDYGGFTGAYQEYILLENGQVFKSSNRGKTHEEFESIDKKAAKDLFKKAATLKLQDRKFNDPGNMTYFINLKKTDQTANVVWGGNQQEIDQDIKLFFNDLKKAIKDKQAKSLLPEIKDKQ